MNEKELIFVYNANSGKWNGYMDIMHKALSPKTYQCKLCDITHGVFSEKKEWAKFRKESPLPLRFLHRDEWEGEFGTTLDLPCVLLKQNDHVESVIGPDELQKMDIEKLMNRIKTEFHQ